MTRQQILAVATAAVVGIMAFAVTKNLHAQAAGTPVTGKIACVDVVKVFNEYQRQKDLSQEMTDVQAKLQDENTQRRQKIDALQAEIDKLGPDDPGRTQRMHDLLAMQIDYKNWVDLKQADMSREIGVWSVKIYKEIVKAVEDIAKRDGYDLVLYRGQFESTSLDPEQIKEQIRSIQILYANNAIDISTVITDKLNADYRTQPRAKMMIVP